MTRRIRTRVAVLGAAAALGIAALVAGPALGDGQPPAGSKGSNQTDFVPGTQPPAGSKASKTTDFVLGGQPAQTNPPDRGGPTTQKAPDEPPGPKSGPDLGTGVTSPPE